MRILKNRSVVAPSLFLLLVFTFLSSGCIYHEDDDDYGIVSVCNYDRYDYLVVLYRESTGRAVDEFWIDGWYDYEHCDEFYDIYDGRYYIAIYRDDDLCCPMDVSESFYIREDYYEGLFIDEYGYIYRD